ncbi:SVWC domain-containing protein [Trichonephila inaurata madagascariensis]|uniref:SVWC domain-containing protein n=1 Tax=Trichonephila inaurata madagascariensis TaxID=2747483 RepID=A0A8X6YA37_9ARAC|nr:SVWC domain-containing protein [Trichonephila inaurata madagascariensis]
MFVRNIIVCTFVVVLFSIHCHGYSFLEPIKFGEGECIDDDWEIHPIGSIWYDKEKCEQLECVYIEDTLYIQGYGCGKIGHPKDCWLVPGNGVNYPTCCPQVECKNGIIW